MGMKRCPTCSKTFTDQNLSFCIDDGTPLVAVPDAADETTVVSPTTEKSSASAETEPYVPRDWQREYQPPGSFEPPGKKRRVWPWALAIVGALLMGIVGLGIALKVMAPRIFSSRANANNSNVRTIERSNSNANTNSVANANTNANNDDASANENADVSEDELAPPPTDTAEVLSDLTSIEHEWTVANINADKRKLDYILADDYVGTSTDNKSQGKAEYLRTATPDTMIEKWDFEDLQVALRGDRATLTGKLRLRVQGQEVVYSFIDKFVWRDARWQAVGSKVERVEP